MNKYIDSFINNTLNLKKRMKRKHSKIILKKLLFIILWTISLGMFAQNITVQGVVTDSDNESVIGATIIVEDNATIGTVTDIDGNYVLNNVPSNGNLEFSYVGMKSQTVPVNGWKKLLWWDLVLRER